MISAIALACARLKPLGTQRPQTRASRSSRHVAPIVAAPIAESTYYVSDIVQ